MEGDWRSSGILRRIAVGGAIVAVLAVGVTAFVLLSDDSDEPATATEAATPGAPPIVSSDTPRPESDAEKKPDEGSKPSKAGGKKGGSNPNRSEPRNSSAATGNASEGRCPEEFGQELCRYMAEAAKAGDGTRIVRPGECPPEWGRDYCKSLRDSVKDAKRNTRIVKPGECPPDFGREYCKSLYEASKQTGG